MKRVAAAVLLGLLFLACAAPPPDAPTPESVGRVEGRLHVIGDPEGAGLGSVVVFLRGPGEDAEESPAAVPLRLEADGFETDLLAVGPQGRVRLENHSGVHHRVFWLDEGRRVDVDLSTAPSGAAEVALARPGVVRIYCDLHVEEYATVFASPSTHFARLGPDASYALDDVRPGTWTLHVWSERVAGPVREIRVDAGRASEQDIWIDLRLARKR